MIKFIQSETFTLNGKKGTLQCGTLINHYDFTQLELVEINDYIKQQKLDAYMELSEYKEK